LATGRSLKYPAGVSAFRTFSLLAILAAAMAGFGGAARADFKDAVVAYDRGAYTEALAEFDRLAEGGHAGAEFMLGAMYFYGKGVRPNHKLAAIWFHKAASKGNPSAQLAFGSLHIRGIGVRQDLVNAYAWLTIAANNGVPGLQQQAIALREDASQLMRPDEIAKAEAAVRDFSARSGGLTKDK
jgi:TPR repeat protein